MNSHLNTCGILLSEGLHSPFLFLRPCQSTSSPPQPNADRPMAQLCLLLLFFLYVCFKFVPTVTLFCLDFLLSYCALSLTQRSLIFWSQKEQNHNARIWLLYGLLALKKTPPNTHKQSYSGLFDPIGLCTSFLPVNPQTDSHLNYTACSHLSTSNSLVGRLCLTEY